MILTFRYYMISLFLCFATFVSIAQDAPYKFSVDISNNLSKEQFPQMYQKAAWDYSNIGEYKKALELYDRDKAITPSLSQKSLDYFKQFKPINAIEYILKRAKKERILIINEAHHQPNHRVFLESLLKGLFLIGYQYIGMEAIDAKDTALNTRKYPVEFSGFYIKQPQFGNLVRTALEDGFSIFGYESKSYIPKEREIEQAKNIKAFLDKNPNAKIIIYCGFAHIVENEFPEWGKAMAGWVKEYTGIDPFTIDQITLTETNSKEYDNPYYQAINLNYYALFSDSLGKLFNGPEGSNQYDVMVYHPRTQWLYGRPHWLFENNRIPYFIDSIGNVNFPCLVSAYCQGEDIVSAIPFDVIELKNKNDNKALSLKSGKYILKIRDVNGLISYLNIEI